MKYLLVMVVLALFTTTLSASIPAENISQITQTAIFGYGKPLRVAYSPDGTQFAVATSIGVWLYDSASPDRPTTFLQGHTRDVFALAYHPNGTQIATGGEDNTVRVWDIATGTEQLTINHRGTVTDLAYSPDGAMIATSGIGSNGLLYLWDATTGDAISQLGIENQSVTRFGFSPDGTKLVTGILISNTITIFDIATATVVSQFAGHSGDINDLTYTADGAFIVSVSDDESLRIWDATTGDEVGSYGQTSPRRTVIEALAYHAPGGQVAMGLGNGDIYLVDLASREETYLGQGRRFDGVRDMVFSADGATLLVASQDDIRLWNIANRTVTATLDNYTSSMMSAAYHPNGTQIATGDYDFDRVVTVWDVATREIVGRLAGLNGVATSLAYSPDGTRLAGVSETRRIVVWDVASGTAVWEARDSHDFGINQVSYSPDGTQIITAGRDQKAHIWNANTGEAILSLTMADDFNRDIVTAIYSPDGATILTANRVSLQIWDANTGAPILMIADENGNISDISSANFSADGGRIVVALKDRTGSASARIYETSTGIELLVIPSPEITRVMFSPDGIFVVGGMSLALSNQDNSLTIWDAIDGQIIHQLVGHTFNITSLMYGEDGTHILTSGQDGSARLWGLPE